MSLKLLHRNPLFSLENIHQKWKKLLTLPSKRCGIFVIYPIVLCSFSSSSSVNSPWWTMSECSTNPFLWCVSNRLQYRSIHSIQLLTIILPTTTSTTSFAIINDLYLFVTVQFTQLHEIWNWIVVLFHSSNIDDWIHIRICHTPMNEMKNWVCHFNGLFSSIDNMELMRMKMDNMIRNQCLEGTEITQQYKLHFSSHRRECSLVLKRKNKKKLSKSNE